MLDIQNLPDARGIALDQVGISGLRYPIVVLDRDKEQQQTIGEVTMSVRLPADVRGTHMSRFLEVLEQHRGEMTARTIPTLLGRVRQHLGAEQARIAVRFEYFIDRVAPVSGARAPMNYFCSFVGESTVGKDDDFVLGVRVPITTLCPCSKAISDYGAHNQRGYVTIEVRSTRNDQGELSIIWIEDLIAVAESVASSPVYSLLKRPDERHVTMQAFDNPRFVEDIVRGVVAILQTDDRVAWLSVQAQTEESIHNHCAFASREWTRPSTTREVAPPTTTARYSTAVESSTSNHSPAALPSMQLLVGGHGSTVQKEHTILGVPRMYNAADRSHPKYPQEAYLDSGAFTDSPEKRLDPAQALERQFSWEEMVRREWGIPWIAKGFVSYDRLIDETWVVTPTSVQKIKQRWSVEDAESAVEETITGARYLSSQRTALLPRKLIIAAQGVNTAQYVSCAQSVLEYCTPYDWFGLGGWCLLGRTMSMLPVYHHVIREVVPLISAAGVRHVHIFGMTWLKALSSLQWMADQYGLTTSVDSSRPLLDCSYTSERGMRKAGVRHKYWRDNVLWWQQEIARLRESEHYREPPVPTKTTTYFITPHKGMVAR